jgi:hypothetical protein
MKKQPTPPAAPLGPPHYRGPSGDVSNAEAMELVQRYQVMREAMYQESENERARRTNSTLPVGGVD